MTKTEAETTAARKREKAAKSGQAMRVEVGAIDFGDHVEYCVHTKGYDGRAWNGNVTYWKPPPYAKEGGND